MKKLLIFSVLCLALSNVYAQSNRIAVINFKANVGIMQSDVDGIASIFTTYFSPRGWQLVERTQIDKVIKEQNFQKSSMTEEQMVRIGKILNLQKIVIGDVSMIAGGYNVDIRIVDVETGAIAAKDGETWNSGISYRELMQSLATRLADKIAIVYMPKPIEVNAPNAKANDVITIYDYLHIYPENLGVFTSEPSNIISALNRKNDYGYNTWRLPTQEELELMFSNSDKIVGIDMKQPYMTDSNSSAGGRRIVRLVTTGRITKVVETSRPRETPTLRPVSSSNATTYSKYKIGDFYNENGKKGIIFYLDDSGRHGKIVALKDADERKNRNSADAWCRLYNGKLPSSNDLKMIYDNIDLINARLSDAGGYPIMLDGYWSSTSSLSSNKPMYFNMRQGVGEFISPDIQLFVRPVYTF